MGWNHQLDNHISSLGGAFKKTWCSPLLGEIIQLDEHIFHMGWNHELVVTPIGGFKPYGGGARSTRSFLVFANGKIFGRAPLVQKVTKTYKGFGVFVGAWRDCFMFRWSLLYWNYDIVFVYKVNRSTTFNDLTRPLAKVESRRLDSGNPPRL